MPVDLYCIFFPFHSFLQASNYRQLWFLAYLNLGSELNRNQLGTYQPRLVKYNGLSIQNRLMSQSCLYSVDLDWWLRWTMYWLLLLYLHLFSLINLVKLGMLWLMSMTKICFLRHLLHLDCAHLDIYLHKIEQETKVSHSISFTACWKMGVVRHY